jgi:hypothetical protein
MIVYPEPYLRRAARLSPPRLGSTSSDLHGSQVIGHRLRLAKSFRFRSYVNASILHYFGANKSFRIRSYRHPARNPFRIRSYRYPGGVEPPSSGSGTSRVNTVL